MSADDIARLPVGQVAALDSMLFLWTTGPLLPQALAVMEAWGFEYKTQGFIWTPRTADGQPVMRTGYYTRQGGQVCLLGTRGSPTRSDRGVRQVLDDPAEPDGGKPVAVRERVERLTTGPYLHLFAEGERPGWTILPGWDPSAMGTGGQPASGGWEIVSHEWRRQGGRQVLADERVHAYAETPGRARLLVGDLNQAGFGRQWSIRRRIPALPGLAMEGEHDDLPTGEAPTGPAGADA